MNKLLFDFGSTLLLACNAPARRPLGASCGDDDECVSGMCLANQCVSPAGDEDDDGLTNAVEAALGTDAFERDTDLDGVGAWTEPKVIVAGDAARPMLTVDAAGRALVLYSNEAADHWLRRGVDGTWSEGRPLGTRTSYQRRVVEDQAGFVWTSWVDEDGTVGVLRLGPASAGWTVIARFERGADEQSRGPAHMGLTPDGDALVSWGADLGASDRVSATTCRRAGRRGHDLARPRARGMVLGCARCS